MAQEANELFGDVVKTVFWTVRRKGLSSNISMGSKIQDGGTHP
jgi:hypothetical protein